MATGVSAGVYIVNILDPDIIKTIFGVTVFLVALKMILGEVPKNSYQEKWSPSSDLMDRIKYFSSCMAGGVIAGSTGLGGGAILVTLNRSMLKMDAKKAAGTSYLVTATIVPVALLSHLVINQNLDVIVDHSGIFAMVLVPLMVFSSAFFGAKYAIKYLPKQVVTGVFLFVVSISLLRYIVDFLTVI